MDDGETQEQRKVTRSSVLGPDAPGATADQPSTTVATLTVLACVVILAVLVGIVAVAAGNWIDQRRQQAIARRHINDPPTPAVAAASVPRVGKAAGLRGNPAAAFGPDSYPPEAIRRGEQGRVVARLTVDTAGRVTKCEVATSSGSPRLDEATCRLARGRVRFSPALGEDGRPIVSNYTLPVRWVLPDMPPPSSQDEGMPGWVGLVLGAFGIYEAFVLRAGLRTGIIKPPRSGAKAVRATSPGLFTFYAWVHGFFAVFWLGLALVMLASTIGFW